MSLLEQAKLTQTYPPSPRKNNYSDEQINVALAWMRGEITIRQAASVLRDGKNISSARMAMATIIREAYRQGKITCQNTEDQFFFKSNNPPTMKYYFKRDSNALTPRVSPPDVKG